MEEKMSDINSYAFGQVQAVVMGWEKRSQKGESQKRGKGETEIHSNINWLFLKTCILDIIKYLQSNY